MTKSQRSRLIVGAALSLAIGVMLALTYMNLFTGGSFLLRLVFSLGLTFVSLFGFWVILIVFVMGVMKIRAERQHDFEQLGDENVVHSDPDGERKLHDYLTAITSTEARIGMLQRSAPYVPPEKRPPPDFKPLRAMITPGGWRAMATILCLGCLAGVALGWLYGLDVAADGNSTVAVMRLFVAGMVGTLATFPVALLVALFFAKVRDPDDTRTDRPETA